MQQTTREATQSSEIMDEPLDYDDFHEDTPTEQREQRRRPLRAAKKPKPFESSAELSLSDDSSTMCEDYDDDPTYLPPNKCKRQKKS
jgi:hypothetical protein